MIKVFDWVRLKGQMELYPDGPRLILLEGAISKRDFRKQQSVGISVSLDRISGEVRKVIKGLLNIRFQIAPGVSVWCNRLPIKYVTKEKTKH